MSFSDHRLLTESQLAECINQYRAQGRRLVFVHGHFSVVHPGHTRFLQYARQQGDILFAGVLSDPQYLELSGRQAFFPQEERLNQVANINLVDHVVKLEDYSVIDWAKQFSPECYVLGSEYEYSRYSEVDSLVEIIQSYGGKVVYHSGDINLPNLSLSNFSIGELHSESQRRFTDACRRHDLNKQYLLESLRNVKNCRALVIGDTIVDQYVACSPIGMSSESPVIVVKELQPKEHIGGAAIVAMHVKALGAQCDYISVAGNDCWHDFVKSRLEDVGVGVNLYVDKERPTTFKIRYMVGAQKLFRVSRLSEKSIPKNIETQIIKSLRQQIDKYDVVIVSDFVYGVITDAVLDEVRRLCRKHNKLLVGDLQCSSQIGDVKKFVDFDIITPTEREARVALSNYNDGIEQIAHSLFDKVSIKNLVLTMGEDGLVAYHKTSDADAVLQSQDFPALDPVPLDVVGSGDVCLATLSVCYSQNSDLMASAALASCAAAVMVKTLGNTPINVSKVENLLQELL